MDLIINKYGTKVGCSGERIVLSFPNDKQKKEYPVRRLEKIVILRPSSITTHAVRLALDYDVDIVYLGSFGKPVGRVFTSEPKGLAKLRRAQLETAASLESLNLAREIVKGKCRNQIEYLRFLGYRYKKDFNKELLQTSTMLKTIEYLPHKMESKEQLLGIEGYIAERYFSALQKLFRFPGRKPQERDKFNSTLNYGYGILYNEVERLCLYTGLDPYLGFYHGERYGKPSLVLDLVENLRVPVVDSVIFPLFIEKRFGKRSYFDKIALKEYQLSTVGKAIIVEAVLKRLNQVTVWWRKKYSVKDAIEQEIRALARYLLGKERRFINLDLTSVFSKNE